MNRLKKDSNFLKKSKLKKNIYRQIVVSKKVQIVRSEY